MAGTFNWADRLPVAPLKIAALNGITDFASQVDKHILQYRKEDLTADSTNIHFQGFLEDSYLVDIDCPRYGTGEGKGIIIDSVRGSDLYIMCDVTNNSIEYSVNGYLNHMSPDDHYQDLKRIIGSAVAVARRVTVIIPFLYESRQHKRKNRESLDCANCLEELYAMGVDNIITFDAHDPRVQNAIPLGGFENILPTYQFVKNIFNKIPDVQIDKEHIMCVSPDEGAMDRAIYLANNLGVDVGMFYKRRDYSVVVDGRNPIVAHEFLGSGVEGKTLIVVDDMISSGESMLDTARELKELGAKNVIVCCTFGLFTNGLAKFDEAYEKGHFDYICTTNANYHTPELYTREWYIEADITKYLAAMINSLNFDANMPDELTPNAKIQKYLSKRKNDGYEYFESIV